ncbi:calcium-binding protein [Phenylobacterium sp. J367]|uniref:calcium-binding protein n=1 Tax=Phenylobacterium sp. J367 TaxID=2898435 RepID=UPI0021516DD3|nr:calcium-binding protein [Phenylobacterium sp. J367]MCR5878896.1 calcium-binding protein [Phenylobacterium sp. J367]
MDQAQPAPVRATNDPAATIPIITFARPTVFSGDPAQPEGDLLRSLLADAGRYTLEVTPQKVVITGAAGAPMAGWRLELYPVTTFTSGTVGQLPFTGQVESALLFNAAGELVATIEDLPTGTNIALLNSGLANLGAEFVGSSGGDTITGYAATDFLIGGGGDDVLHGGAGDAADYLEGGAGADTLNGGGGNDVLVGATGADRFDGGAGDDLLLFADGTGFVELWLDQAAPAGQLRADGIEIVWLPEQGARVHGGALADAILGGAGADEIDGAGGDDILAGLWGNDTLRGGDGWDLMDGGPGADVMDGGDGYDAVDYSAADGSLTIDLRIAAAQQTGFGLDTLISIEDLWGSLYADTLNGNASDNYFTSLSGNDLMNGFGGNDDLAGGGGGDQIFGGDGDDTLSDIVGLNYLRGEAGDDSLSGGSAFDDLHGNMGNDTVAGGGGDDWVVGGKDNDLLDGQAGADIVYGNLGDDTCAGGDGADIVRGGQGADTVSGGAADDWLAGDRGDDTLTGGTGADIFHTHGDAGLDRVLDFDAAAGDRVNLLAGTQYTTAQVGADMVISMAGGGQMVLVGVTLSSLPSGWIFGA